MRVYIASPYTIGNQAENMRRQIDTAEKLIRAGHFPYVPLLYHFWHFVHPHEAEYWLRQDNEWLSVCDAMIRLPGPSSGGDAEVKLAESLWIPVYNSVEEFLASFVDEKSCPKS